MLSRPAVALVPLRSPGVGKTRLAAEGLGSTERARLSAAMLADVTHALRNSDLDAVVVAAAGPEAAAAGAALGLDVLVDPPNVRSLDAAVAAAQVRLRGVGSLVVVMADLPRLTPDDVETVLRAEGEVVIAPTRDGGTGALLRTPPNIIGTAYGKRSAYRHRNLAERAGATVATVRTDGFRQDVDTLADLNALQDGLIGAATAQVLENLLDVADPPA
ncbi:MAG: 2-phospho-L-lactate guanylyltransferase [Nitriliruptorales bacterium]|nr:2-phospho-L-lactate guanylyltransferase [Nitriliruptorales bacterium]